jgi:hypothetical protein
MNYRTLAKGALALSLSLIVGSAMATTTVTDVQKYGATFESTVNTTAGQLNDFAYEEGTNVTKYAVTGGDPRGWFGAAEDESKIIAANGGQALQLNTDAATLTNKLATTIAADINDNGIAAAGAYIETEAKFVASDTLDAGVVGGTDDTKFAIYAYADENASPCTTNLVVYHAYYDGNGEIAYTNEIFDTLVDCDVYTKLRVEMKQMKNPSRQNVNVFSVKVGNSAALASENALDAYLDEELNEGIWFLTVEDQLGGNATKQLATINFKGTGEVDNLAVGIIQETTTYAIDWSASQNVIASNLTANAQLAAGETNFANNVQLAFYPTEGNVITNVLLNGDAIDGVMFPIDSYSYTVNSTDATLTILAGTQAAPATVISVATVGNATVTDNQDGTYTISVPLDNGLSSVFVNGAAVDPSLLTEGQGGTYTLDVSSLSGNVNVVIATKKVRTPIGHKWFENPGVIATNLAGKGGDAGPYKFSVGSDFAAISYGNHDKTGTGFKLFSVDDLLGSDATPIYTETRADAQSLNINSIRGAAISEALDVALITAYNGGKAYSLPLSANTLELGVNAFEITNDRGITFDRAYFSADNQYLYTTEVDGGTNTKIAKWAIADGLKGSGQKLTLVTEYTMPSRVRDFAYAVINNKELFYVLKDGTAGVCVYDVAGGTNVQLTAQLSNGGNYGSVAVSMTSTSTPTLTVLPSMNSGTPDPMAVYQLAADGLSIANTLATFTVAELTTAGVTGGSYIRSAWPSEDDETLYLGYGSDKLYVLQYVEPPTPTVISIALVNGATYTDANGTLTFAAPPGYTISSIFTNGVNTGSTTTFTTNGLTGTVKIIAAATKTRTAPEHKWYESPGVIGSTEWGIGAMASGEDSHYYGPYNMDVDGDFIAVPTWTGSPSYLELYNRDAVDAGNAPYLAKIDRADYDYSFMGSGICVPLNVAIAGAYSGSHVVAFPLNNPNPVLGEDAFVISNSLNATLIQFKFTDDAQYVYARPYSGTVVYKFKVLNGLKTTGVNLVDPVTYEFNQRVRSIELAQIGGKDIVYALLEDKTISVVDTSVNAPTATNLVSDVALSKYINISVSGIADGTPHLTVASCTQSATRVDVYTLNAAGTAVDTSIEKMSFNTAAVTAWGVSTGGATGADAVVVDDEGTLYLGYGRKLYAIQYVLPTYAVDWTGSTNVNVTVDGLAHDGGTSGSFTNGTVIAFTADSGMMITNVAGEAYGPASTFTLTVTEATNIVVKAGVSQPIGRIKPEWAEQADTTKFWAWVDDNHVSDYASVDYTTEYLLNIAPQAGVTPELKIVSIAVGASATTIEVTCTAGRLAVDLANLNGVLNVAVGSSVTALTPKAIPAANLDASTPGWATITIPNADGCFFRARVDFAAPQASLTAISE